MKKFIWPSSFFLFALFSLVLQFCSSCSPQHKNLRLPSPSSSQLSLSSLPKGEGDHWGKLDLKGTRILFAGKEIRLRGVAIPDPEHLNLKSWDRPGIDAQSLVLKAIDELGVNVIRVPVLPDADDHKSGFWRDPEGYWQNHLLPLIKLTQKRKTWMILDLHYESDFLEKKEQVLTFWKMIAPRLVSYPHVLMEVFNEPVAPYDWHLWAEVVARDVVRLIRSYHPTGLIIMGGPRWNTQMQEVLNDPIVDSRILYALHIYPNEWKRPGFFERYQKLVEKYPIFVTEWGFDEEGGKKLADTITGYGKPFLDWMEKNHLSWTIWSYDYRWRPAFFDRSWRPKSGPGGMGRWLEELFRVRFHLPN